MKLVFLICFMLLFFNVFSNHREIIEERVNYLDSVRSSDLHDSVHAIIANLYRFDLPFARSLVLKMSDKTDGRNKYAHLDCLNALASFTPGQEIKLIDAAYAYAKENNLDDYKTDYCVEKSNFFRQDDQLDSSMFYLLTARDLAKVSNSEQYIHILHRLGDLYYSVGLYDDAERYYLQVKEESEGRSDSWKAWRKQVITSNLGLIDVEHERYDEALAIFQGMANERFQHMTDYGDSLSYSYNRRKVAEVLFQKKEYQKSQDVIGKIFPFFEKYHLAEHLVPSYILLIRLGIKMGDQTTVKRYYQQFLNFMETVPSSLEYRRAIAQVKSDVNEYLGNNLWALKYYKQYQMLDDSLSGKDRSAAIIQLVAEKNYEKLEGNLSEVSVQRYYMALIILLITGFSVLIFLRSRKISKLNSLLVKTNNTKEKLFSVIAHDLLSPFNTLVGLSRIISEDLKEKDYAEAEESCKALHEESKNLHELVLKLLNWARSQQGDLTVNPELISMNELVDSVVSLHEQQARNKSIQIQCNSSGDYSIRADKNMVSTVLSNLLVNALKFTPENGLIIFKTTADNDFFKLSIVDNGIGMSNEKLAGLFDTATSSSSPGTNNEKGTGLGLLTCKEFVEKNHGTIEVSSIVGKGTTFLLKFRLA